MLFDPGSEVSAQDVATAANISVDAVRRSARKTATGDKVRFPLVGEQVIIDGVRAWRFTPESANEFVAKRRQRQKVPVSAETPSGSQDDENLMSALEKALDARRIAELEAELAVVDLQRELDNNRAEIRLRDAEIDRLTEENKRLKAANRVLIGDNNI